MHGRWKKIVFALAAMCLSAGAGASPLLAPVAPLLGDFMVEDAVSAELFPAPAALNGAPAADQITESDLTAEMAGTAGRAAPPRSGRDEPVQPAFFYDAPPPEISVNAAPLASVLRFYVNVRAGGNSRGAAWQAQQISPASAPLLPDLLDDPAVSGSIAELLAFFLRPSISDEGVVSFSLAGVSGFTLMMSEDMRMLSIGYDEGVLFSLYDYGFSPAGGRFELPSFSQGGFAEGWQEMARGGGMSGHAAAADLYEQRVALHMFLAKVSQIASDPLTIFALLVLIVLYVLREIALAGRR